MYHTNFVHLHVHSHFSILDGAAPVKAIVAAARRFRMPALALTDHGNMFGAIEFYLEAMKKGVKPILGFEAYVAPNSRHDKHKADQSSYHLVLLARNITGYQNLVKLSTLGYTEGFYYRPRVDIQLLEKYGDGLLALGGCLQGEVQKRLSQGNRDEAVKAALKYKNLFGAENFYLELQDHGLPEQRAILPSLVDLARECSIPLVATNDSHYVNPEDWEAQDALMCLQTGSTLADRDRLRFSSREFYMKSPEAMTMLFKEIPEAISNTLKVADRCNVKLELGKPLLPIFPIPEGKTAESYLEELCRTALPTRYPEPDEIVINRLEYELGVMRKMGFCGYFLIVWDFVRKAREMKVPVGPGRGSAAGSLIAYLLGITDIDPLKYGLLFERFLNPDRISMPDIDIDFSDDGRDKVIDYVVEKYGRTRVSKIITFNYILAKLAIRDIGRVLSVPLPEVDRIAKMVPEKPGIHLKDAMKDVSELRDIAENGTAEQKRLLQIAATVDGLVRHTGIHACGIVISRIDLMDIVPLYLDKSKELVTQYEKNCIEKIGLLKMDFLGLKTLSVIKRALDYIEENPGVKIDFSRIEFDDLKTFELLQKAMTMGVFQLESAGMRSLISRLQPTVFEDIIALLAMYRPGPLGSGMVDDFVERKHGRKQTAYLHPELEPILKDTYGVFLYQEQCMKTANVLADFTMGQADALRKAMAKKIPEDMERMGKLFVEGASKRGISSELSQSIFDLMASFAEYGFNKSHSAAYAVITFRTAYLKAHYPAQFMAAVLSSEIDDTDKIAQYVAECREMSIQVLAPDVNKSCEFFTVENNAIRYGLSAIKGVGSSAAEAVVSARSLGGEFKSLSDLTRRVDTHIFNNRVIEALIKSGGFDCFNLKRSQLLIIAPEAHKSGQQIRKEKAVGQATFFDLLGSEADDLIDTEIPIPDIPELSERELLNFEKEVMGFFFSGDPFKEISSTARLFSSHSVAECRIINEETTITTAGLLTSLKKHSTKKGDLMAFITIEAENVSLDITIFPRTYAQVAAKLQQDEPIFLVIKTQAVGDDIKANAEAVFTAQDFNQEGFCELNISISSQNANKDTYQKLHAIIRKYPGTVSFKLEINTPEKERVKLKPPSQLRVELSQHLLKDIAMVCGEGAVTANFPEIEALLRKNGSGKHHNNHKNGFSRINSVS